MSDDQNTIEFTDKDWDNIFPVEFVMVGSQQVPIKALCMEDISGIITKQLPTIMGMFTEEIEAAVRGKKISTQMILGKLKSHMTNVSFLITEAGANLLHSFIPAIKASDFKKFPPPIILELVAKALSVNLLSLEQMEKNFKPLVENFRKLVAMRGAVASE